jgi:signal peptidase I
MSIAERRTIGTTEQQPPAVEKRTAFLPSMREIVQTAAVTALVFSLTLCFVAQGYQVFGRCMDPNLRTGERLLGSKLAYKFHAPYRGDIVVFEYPGDRSKIYVKRVIGLPGETVEIRHGSVFINNKLLKESYLVHLPHGDYRPSVVESDRLFVMGDYRDCSNDSRSWGQLPISDIQAKAWLRYWPVRRASVLR